ncbi:MAG: SCO family protein [Planctomycetaceae bacterium]|nr:SCO family protein [Planctomycetaceae bacterium]
MILRTRKLPLIAAFGLAVLLAIPSSLVAAGPDGVVPGGNEQPTHQPDVANIGIDQNLGVQLPLDLVFRDESERPITLREAMQGKVTILVPVYFRCPDLCTRVLNGLVDGLRALPQDFTVGDKFNVVTISMDPKEHADLGSAKKKAYLAEYGRPNAEDGWRFITGKKEPVGELLKTVGYHYEYDKAFKEYKHPSGIIILTPDGKVSRYFFGIGYDDPVTVETGTALPKPTWNALRLSIVEASGGKIGSLADRLTLACSRFDHLKQGYALSIMVVVKLGGLLTMLLVGGWVALALRRERRHTATSSVVIAGNDTQNGPSNGLNGQPGVPA